MFDMIRSVVVVVNELKPFTHASCPNITWDYYQDAVVRGFFYCLMAMLNGGITHPLRMWMRQTQINVLNRACVSYLKFGAVKTLEGLTPFKLDKREHLSCG